MSWRNYCDKVKRYCPPSRLELQGFIIIVLIFAFIHSFDKWGANVFDASAGIKNFLVSLVIVGVGVFVHHLAQRLMSVFYGFRPEHTLWWFGHILGLALVIVTNGFVKFFAASGLFIHMLEAHRLGWHRYGPNVEQYANIALMGPLANIFLAMFVKTLELIEISPFSSDFVSSFFVFNLWFAGLNLLPIPPPDGSKIFYDSRLFYVFLASSVIAYAALVAVGVYSAVYALLIGGGVWLVYYLKVES